MRRRRPMASVLGVLAIASLVGCPAPNIMAPPTDQAPPAAPLGHGSQAFLLDIDPFRASAFERPTAEHSQGGLQLLVAVPEVRHDPATGRTDLRVEVTNAGPALNELAVRVGGDRRLVAPVASPAGPQASGETRTYALSFDNPGGDSFALGLDFSAKLLADAPAPAKRQVLATGVSAVSASSSYGSLVPGRAVDGDLSTQWANDGYKAPEAWLMLDLGTSQALAALKLKMQPQSGDAYYRIEVSEDGRSFTPVTASLKNTTWNLETKGLPAGTQGRYVRVHFFNGTTSPEVRFSVFEAIVEGGTGSAPTPAPSSSPSSSPTSTPSPTPAPSSGGLTASASSSYSNLTPDRSIDGDTGSQWASGGYRDAEAWLMFDTGAVRTLSSLNAKMRPQSGAAYYRLEVSSDGSTFTPVTGSLKNTTWNFETKSLPAGTQGRYLRVHFYNDPAAPMDRFSVFEAQVGSGGSTSSPSPTPTPAPTATPTPAPTTSPSTTPSGSLLDTFEQYALGADPAAFIDPIDEGYSYSWMPRVTWRVASQDGSKQYMHDGLSNMANLSFRRYRGGALGTSNGALPGRYFAEVDVTPIKSYTYSPTGDQGTQFYYLDPTNYVELLIKPNLFEVWVANDAQPFQSTGWSRIYYTSVNTSAGQKRKLGAEIDTNAHTIKVYLDGQYLTTLSSGKLTNQAHYFALRGTGNIVTHDNLRIEPR